jgi:hypothetical protein
MKTENSISLKMIWGQICENQNKPDEALRIYEECKSSSSLVRMMCAMGQYKEAEKVALKGKDVVY